MKKIAFSYNSCICMILILPYFDVLTSCVLYMHSGAWRVCRAFSSVQKKYLKVLEMYLATAVATRGEFPSIRDVSN